MIRLRTLLEKWPLSLLAVFILGSCLGLNALLLSVVETTLLNLLPFPQPDGLVVIETVREDFQRKRYSGLKISQIELINESSRLVESAAGYLGPVSRDLASESGRSLETCSLAAANPELFPILGMALLKGRPFDQAEEDVAVVRIDLYRRLYGEAPFAGQAVRVAGGKAYRIVGIAPLGLEFPDSRTQMWVPLPGGDGRYAVVARLKDPGVLKTAAVELTRILEKELLGRSLRVLSIRESKVGQVRPALLALWVTSLGLLLISLFNFTNLQMLRFEAQKPAWVLRKVMGAQSLQVFIALLQQNLVFCGLSLLAGLWLAHAAFPLVEMGLPMKLPRLDRVDIVGTSLVPGLILASLLAALLTLFMQRQLAQAPVMEILRAGHDQAGSRKSLRKWRTPVLAVQVSLALILVYSSALLALSFHKIVSVDPGFHRDVQAVELAVPSRLYRNVSEQRSRMNELLARVRSLPGIVSAGVGSSIPAGRAGDEMSIDPVNSALPDRELLSNVRYTVADAGYLETLDPVLIRGRSFQPREASPVALANRRLAEEVFPGSGGVGEIILKASGTRIVGVLEDFTQVDLRIPTQGELFLYWGDAPPPTDSLLKEIGMPRPVLVWRTTSDPARTLADIKAIIQSSMPEARILSQEGPWQKLQSKLGQPRFIGAVIAVIALVGLILAVAGSYGVSAAILNQRMKEFGLRSALGATPGQIVWLTLRDITAKAAAGLLAGGPVALLCAQVFRSILFQLEPFDLTVLSAAAAAMAASVFAAALIPALRAYRFHPSEILREV